MLNPTQHQPVRTRLVAWLSSHGESTFTEIKEILGVTEGNLESQYGRKQFQLYVKQLQDLLNEV